ncbi:CRISPR-associated helicase/endonuclease Cas3 [Roseospirillum parvum]|uniref:CRISPR-associated endonuclease/helicase Cas3 n=1 Tax=Roseospirillum parvum TaxID=83401 RepID=A0A1G8EDY0_9PROT|nr:CRISPR-associated helicase/endonuclease Cas3 [Roseospirillum parvum]SDH68084.1 CRISPR-associated endonuclease/helicase Cas3 [Roseospirillum parvum]
MRQPFLAFWGKAHPSRDAPLHLPTHPLVCHALDVAAVAERLLAADPLRRRALAEALALPETVCTPLLVTLAALHDMGKFALPFQAKVPAHLPAVLGGHAVLADPGHDTAGWLWFAHLCPPEVAQRLGPRRGLNQLLPAAFGHHGRPPRDDPGTTRDLARRLFPPPSRAAANAFAGWVVATLAPAEPPPLKEAAAKRAALAVAGLIATADWIGSAQGWFPYAAAPDDPAAYWHQVARPAAATAVAEAGVVPAPAAPARGLAGLTGGADLTPTPLQQWAATVALPAHGPVLALLEDLTGSGKTEAALLLAHRLMAAGRAGGLYLALPTQATANAMFDRLGALYRRLFAASAAPSLALAHGDRGLHPGFRAARLPAAPGEGAYGGGVPQTPADEPAGAQCAAWIADDRRLAFLADVGAGTVDQALLSVLPARHTGLRRFGLLGKVLILDEVHAYDAYVGEEIAALIEAHAALGGHTLLLSATLPATQRARLTAAFARGAGGLEAAGQTATAPYPAATLHGAGIARTEPVDAWTRQARRLPVRCLPTVAAGLDAAEAAARAGGAVLVLRNTVDDAIATHDALAARGLAPLLFHARFALGDRLAIEAEVMRRFGRDSQPEARAGRILVATQVVEQSLDVDFDALVTDLAPIDLLIQRAGRLWRHPRPDRLGTPELLVVAPPAAEDPPADWLRAELPGTAAVYRHAGVLWRTARLIQRLGAFDLPARARELIEAVYGPAATEPPALTAASRVADGAALAGGSKARATVLALSAGYAHAPLWAPDHRLKTRDGDDPVVLRLGRRQGATLRPWIDPGPDQPPALAWRLSQLSWSARWLAPVAWEEPDPELARAAAAARADWGRWERDLPLVALEPGADGTWRGLARDPEGRPRALTYCARRGLGLAGDEQPAPQGGCGLPPGHS